MGDSLRVYISGPMTGYPDYNRLAFRSAAAALSARGYDHPIDPGAVETPDLAWADYLRADLKLLLGCEAVATLPGWQESRGACLEVHVAQALGMTVMPLDRWLA